jgi:hypothetical protein
MRKSQRFLCMVLLMGGLFWAIQATAVPPPPCGTTCTCSSACTTKCSLSNGTIVTCGWIDRCVGGIGCGATVTVAPGEGGSTPAEACPSQEDDLLAAIFG